MKIIRDLTSWRAFQANLKSNETLGLVPTMGSLHDGHIGLIERARKENRNVILSIFINPTQFNDRNDYDHYPRNEKADLQQAEESGVDVVLIPTEAMMYSDNYDFQMMTKHPISQIAEGVARPGHFNGMLTIVLKLLLLIRPDTAYFGEKDFQQLTLVQEMVKTFFLETNIVGCPIVREASGLPYSSRNTRLNVTQRKIAEQFPVIFNENAAASMMFARLMQVGLSIDYVEVYKDRMLAAVQIDEIRLIDNKQLSE